MGGSSGKKKTTTSSSDTEVEEPTGTLTPDWWNSWNENYGQKGFLGPRPVDGMPEGWTLSSMPGYQYRGHFLSGMGDRYRNIDGFDNPRSGGEMNFQGGWQDDETGSPYRSRFGSDPNMYRGHHWWKKRGFGSN